MSGGLTGKRILLVEDEALVAAMAEDMLVELGAIVVGPAPTIAKALALAADPAIDAAVLDVNVRGERIDPVVEALQIRGVPLVLATGYAETIAVAAPGTPVLGKPYTMDKLEAAIGAALARKAGP